MQETADLVTFTIEIPNGKLHFLCSEFEFCSESHHLVLTYQNKLLSYLHIARTTLHKKCTYPEFFLSVFFRIPAGYGNLQNKSRYSVQIHKNTE